MQRTKTLGFITFAGLSLGLMACGGDKIDQVREDFNNPTGSTTDRDAVIAVQAQQNGSSPAMGIASGGVPGLGLSAYGKTTGLAQIGVRQWEPRARLLLKAAREGREANAIQHSELVGYGCANSAEADAAFEEIWAEFVLDAAIGIGSASGDATYSVDVGTCSDGALTGNMTVTIEIVANDDEVRFEVRQELDVCEVGGNEACVVGETVMRATGSNDGGSAESAEVLAYWDVAGTWNDDAGTRRSAQLRGGIRIAGESNSSGSTATIEYLFYVQAPDGSEYSYVFELVATDVGGMSTVTWRIRGSDGEISCTADETMVSCTGSATFTYTDADAAAVEGAWFGG